MSELDDWMGTFSMNLEGIEVLNPVLRSEENFAYNDEDNLQVNSLNDDQFLAQGGLNLPQTPFSYHLSQNNDDLLFDKAAGHKIDKESPNMMQPMNFQPQIEKFSETVITQLQADPVPGPSFNPFDQNSNLPEGEYFMMDYNGEGTRLTLNSTILSAPLTPIKMEGPDNVQLTPGRRGRKPNSSKGILSVPKTKEKKVKKWQLASTDDKTVKNAINAKNNRERKKQEQLAIQYERDRLKEENQQLKSENLDLKTQLAEAHDKKNKNFEICKKIQDLAASLETDDAA